jgi:capsular polysaccharide export protein
MHFVFLQGMPSPFFTRVGRGLAALGCRVTGINLCIGDQLFWRGPEKLNYRGTIADWPGFLSDFFDANDVTDLVLLGEQRSYHKVAIEVAKSRGIRVTVTDFGYLRPDWITLERDGMSGNSRFPRNMEEISQIAASVAKADLSRKYFDSDLNMALGDLLYSFSNVFFWWLYPHYRRSDKRPHPIIYFPSIGLRLLLTRFASKHASQRVQEIVQSSIRYFIFPLQLEHDFQIVSYSGFAKLEDAIREIIQSFARNAGRESGLIIKVHPWDPGLRNWKHIVKRLAGESGVADRVEYLNGGDLDELIKRSIGMVTINSTSGLRALQLGKPVVTLGQAIYDVPGLTFQGGLERFWGEASPSEPRNGEAIINALASTIQIRGVFFNEPGLTSAVNGTVARLFNQTVGLA